MDTFLVTFSVREAGSFLVEIINSSFDKVSICFSKMPDFSRMQWLFDYQIWMWCKYYVCAQGKINDFLLTSVLFRTRNLGVE